MQVDSDLNVLVKYGNESLTLYAILNNFSPRTPMIISNDIQHSTMPRLRKQIEDIIGIGVRRVEFLMRASVVGEVTYCIDDTRLITKKFSILLSPRDILLLDHSLSFEVTNQIRDITYIQSLSSSFRHGNPRRFFLSHASLNHHASCLEP